MNGLRVYIKTVNSGEVETREVFYSRRAHGPYYRWSLEKKSREWHGSRMHADDLSMTELALARWTGVPADLQARLYEHYLE